MDREALRDRVRRQTLVSTAELTDAQINQDLEQGILDLATRFGRWPWMKTSDTITLADGTASYALPSDFMFMGTMTHDGEGAGAALERTTEAVVKAIYGDDVGDADLPHLWYETDDANITFVPTPDATKTVNIVYYAVPDLANDFDEDTEEPPFHSAFHIILVDYAISQFWEREEDEQRAQFYLGRFYDGVNRMAEFYTERHPQEPWILGGGVSEARFRRPPYVGWPE